MRRNQIDSVRIICGCLGVGIATVGGRLGYVVGMERLVMALAGAGLVAWGGLLLVTAVWGHWDEPQDWRGEGNTEGQR